MPATPSKPIIYIRWVELINTCLISLAGVFIINKGVACMDLKNMLEYEGNSTSGNIQTIEDSGGMNKLMIQLNELRGVIEKLCVVNPRMVYEHNIVELGCILNMYVLDDDTTLYGEDMLYMLAQGRIDILSDLIGDSKAAKVLELYNGCIKIKTVEDNGTHERAVNNIYSSSIGCTVDEILAATFIDIAQYTGCVICIRVEKGMSRDDVAQRLYSKAQRYTEMFKGHIGSQVSLG